MKVIAFKVNLNIAYSEVQLLKGGWQEDKKGETYFRIKDKYKFIYTIKSIGKIKLSQMWGVLYTEEEVSKYINYPEFEFQDAWKMLWNKPFTPESVEIFMKKDMFSFLIENNWKPSALGVIELISEDYNLSYYYPAPEEDGVFKIVDDNPKDVLSYAAKLNAINIY